MPIRQIGSGDEVLLQATADLLSNSRKIVVITGAGISTSCGIPDFRSKDGLYNLILETETASSEGLATPQTPSRKRKAVTEDDLPPSSQSSSSSTNSRWFAQAANSKLRGQDLFNATVWKNAATTSVFYKFIASLRQKIRNEVKETSLTHKFIRALRDGGRLVRCYTQNIDGLEAREGLSMDLAHGKGSKRRFMKKIFEAPRPPLTVNTEFDGGCEVVPLHGDLDKLRCNLCQATSDWDDHATESFLEGCAPACETCLAKNNDRKAKGRRGVSVGSLRPNVVLYGEEHPSNELLNPLLPSDVASKPEVLIIMGTSLKVYGLQKIVKDFAKEVHSGQGRKKRVVFVNRTKPAESAWDNIIDDHIAMDCDDWVQDLQTRCGGLWLKQGQQHVAAKKADGESKRKRKATAELDVDRPARKMRVSKSKVSHTMICVEIPSKGRAKQDHSYAVHSFTSVLANITTQANSAAPPKLHLRPQLQKTPSWEEQSVAPWTPVRSKTWKHHSPIPRDVSPTPPPLSPFSAYSQSPALGNPPNPILISESSISPDSVPSVPY